MKLKDLIKGNNTPLKVIITESQFKRLADNLLHSKNNKSNKESKKNTNGSKK